MERIEGKLVLSHYNEIQCTARAVQEVAGIEFGAVMEEFRDSVGQQRLDSWSGKPLPNIFPECESVVLNSLRYYASDRRGFRRFSYDRSRAREMLEEIDTTL